MTCDQCDYFSQHSCPCCNENDSEFVTSLKANPMLYDVLSARGRTYVAFTMTPLMLMLWATNVGYDIEISGVEVVLKTANGSVDYCCYPQDAEFMDEYSRDWAVQMAKWM